MSMYFSTADSCFQQGRLYCCTYRVIPPIYLSLETFALSSVDRFKQFRMLSFVVRGFKCTQEYVWADDENS